MAGKIRMYVWHQLPALRDYGDGMLCVIAQSLDEALDLAVERLYAPSRDRPALRAVLAQHATSGDVDVYEAVERGAVCLRGSA